MSFNFKNAPCESSQCKTRSTARRDSGLRHYLSNADSFGVEFRREELPMQLKKLLLAASFLIDFTCFEGGVGRWFRLLDFG